MAGMLFSQRMAVCYPLTVSGGMDRRSNVAWCCHPSIVHTVLDGKRIIRRGTAWCWCSGYGLGTIF